MDHPRLQRQIEFLIEIDALKRVLRQSHISDGSRQENTAEHSWHLALCAMVLSEHANEPVDVTRVVQMLLVHDLVEIDAGDTFIYATHGADDAAAVQEAAERLAADRIFALLPEDQGSELRALWDEFEAKQTPEARFAKSVDRLQPMLLNRVSGGGSWSAHAITADKPRRLIDATMPPGSKTLAAYAHHVLDCAIAEGVLLPPA